MTEEVAVEQEGVPQEDYSYDKPDLEEVVDKLLNEYGCVDWDSCQGHKQDIIKRLIEEYDFSLDEVADHFGYTPQAIKGMLARALRMDAKYKGEKTTKAAKKFKSTKQTTKKGVDASDVIEDDVAFYYGESDSYDTDLGISIEHPFSEYIPSKIRVNNQVYTPDELVEEFGTSGLRLLKIQSLLRVLKYGPAFKTPPKRFIKAIAQALLSNSALVDDYQTLNALLSNYRIENNLIAHAFTVLSYLDQQYRALAESVDRTISAPIVSWMSIEKDGSTTFIPNTSGSYFPSNGNFPQPNPTFPNVNNPQPNPYSFNIPPNYPQPYPNYPMTPPYPPVPQPPAQTGLPPEAKEALKKKDEEIEQLKEMIGQLLEEKRRKEEEEERQKFIEAIKETIESKISSVSSRLSLLEQKMLSGSDDEDKEKELLLKQIETLKEELKDLKTEMTKKEIESLKSMIATLEKRLEEASKGPFQGGPLNQYMVEFMIKKLETDAELAKVQEQSKVLENLFDRMKDTLTRAADTFGRAIGREMVMKKPEGVKRKDDLIYTVCPICGATFAYPKDSIQVFCPKCGYQVLKPRTKKKEEVVEEKVEKSDKKEEKGKKGKKKEKESKDPLETPVE